MIDPWVMCACGCRYGWHPIPTLCTGTNAQGTPCPCRQFVSTDRSDSLGVTERPQVRVECLDCAGSGECGSCDGSGNCNECDGHGEITIPYDEVEKRDKVLGEVAA